LYVEHIDISQKSIFVTGLCVSC